MNYKIIQKYNRLLNRNKSFNKKMYLFKKKKFMKLSLLIISQNLNFRMCWKSIFI